MECVYHIPKVKKKVEKLSKNGPFVAPNSVFYSIMISERFLDIFLPPAVSQTSFTGFGGLPNFKISQLLCDLVASEPKMCKTKWHRVMMCDYC